MIAKVDARYHRAAGRSPSSVVGNGGRRGWRFGWAVAAALVAASVFVASGSTSAGVVVSPDSKPTGHRIVGTVHVGGNLVSMALDSAGHLLYVLEDSPRMAVIDTRTRRVVRIVKLPGRTGPGAVAVDPATRRVYVTCADGTMRVFAYGATRQMERLRVGEGSSSIAVDTRARRVYVAVEAPLPTVSIIETTTERVVGHLQLPDALSPDSLAVDPPRHTLYVAGAVQGAGVLAVVNTRTDRVRATLRLRDAYDIALNPLTHALYVTNRQQGSVTVVSGHTDRVVRVTRSVHGAAMLAVDAAHQSIFVGNLDENLVGQTVSVIDVGPARLVDAIQVPRMPTGIVVDPRTGLLYVASLATGTVTVIRVDFLKKWLSGEVSDCWHTDHALLVLHRSGIREGSYYAVVSAASAAPRGVPVDRPRSSPARCPGRVAQEYLLLVILLAADCDFGFKVVGDGGYTTAAGPSASKSMARGLASRRRDQDDVSAVFTL